MKAITKYLMMMFAMLAMSVSFSSCGEDGDDEIIEEPVSGVVGRWSTSDGSVIFYFDKDGTGTWTTISRDSNGNSATVNYNFVYTYNESTGVLKVSIKGASSISNFEVNLTGNTMMLTFYENGNRYSYVLTR